MLVHKFFKHGALSSIVNTTRQIHTPDFTKNNYNIKRGSYNAVEDSHISFFQQLLGGNRVATNISDLEKYNVDWFLVYRGSSSVVLKPKTTQEVSKILQFCNNNKLAVCTQGGNTSVVGGGVSVFDEIIISTELMNNIIEINDTAGTVTCQSGCILENLNIKLADHGLMMPVDLGAKGSCHIGGNVATNAGGKRLLRYGNLHGNVLGLEAVKANGEIIDCVNTLRKNNTGFHLKNLFIGSEGTLGIITKVAMQCPKLPNSVNVAFLGLQNYEKVLKTLKKAKADLGEILSAFEVMDASSIQLLEQNSELKSPIGEYPFYVLIETSGSNEAHDELKINEFLDSLLKEHYALNGTLSSGPQKVQSLWDIRERIPEAWRKTWSFSYDVTLPLQHFYEIVTETRSFLGDKVDRVLGFGHLGDGNLHLVILTKKFDKDLKETIENFVINRTIELKGSISAEHGMGFQKAKYLSLVNSPEYVDLMRNIKFLLDPNQILNPYKVFP